MPWQLKKISTNQVVESADSLPENWGPIFGLHGVKDKLNDLSWVGMEDLGWFELSPDIEIIEEEPSYTDEQLKRNERDRRLAVTDWAAMPDVPLNAATKDVYLAYRQELRDITLSNDWPANIIWPVLVLPE